MLLVQTAPYPLQEVPSRSSSTLLAAFLLHLLAWLPVVAPATPACAPGLSSCQQFRLLSEPLLQGECVSRPDQGRGELFRGKKGNLGYIWIGIEKKLDM